MTTDTKPDVSDEFTKEFREKTVKFRGRTFLLRELPIADYDKIVVQSTDKITLEDGSIDERLDNQRQSRLMLAKSIVTADPPLPSNGIVGLGTAVVVALNRVVNELHYADEVDELAPKKKASSESEGDKKGND